MKTGEIESRLRAAAEHAAPRRTDELLSACGDKRGEVIAMTENKRRKIRWPVAAAAAAVALLAAGVLGFVLGRTGGTESAALTAVMFDVNPSVELVVDEAREVQKAEALNPEGEEVIGGMQLEGTNLETATNALIGAFLRCGYIDELHNAILISVESREGGQESLAREISDSVRSLLESGGLEAAVFSQTVTSDERLVNLAEQYRISPGRAALIEEIAAQDGALSFETLSQLSVTELVLLTQSRSLTVEGVSQTGEVGTNGYIGGEEAFNLACVHAGVEPGLCLGVTAELDYEDGIMVYEVSFCLDGTEYDYDVNASTGEIVDFDTERCDHPAHQQSAATPAQLIGESAAVDAACVHAGVAKTEALGLTVKLDDDRYEVEFCYGGTEYEYEIDAYTGAVAEYDTGRCDHPAHQQSGTTPAQLIGESAAVDAACVHAGVAKTEALGLTVKLDDDRYEVEFCYGGTEYEYEIDAYTGAVAEYDTGRCDHPAHQQSGT